jgi:transposase
MPSNSRTKKTLRAAEQARPDVKANRQRWHPALAEIPLARLVFLDESGASTTMTRLRGWAPRGERAVGAVPQGDWKTVTLLCAIRRQGPVAPLVFEGALNGEIFLEWTQRFLRRELRAGDVVVLDNLRTHAVAGFEKLVRSRGARVLYLPPYSPDFNPIENMWSKVKAYLRKAKARTFDALVTAVGKALASVSKEDCIGFFHHCGYV